MPEGRTAKCRRCGDVLRRRPRNGADRTLASTNALIGPDSNVNAELRRTLIELSEAARALALAAEQFQTQPDSVIFGKEGSQ